MAQTRIILLIFRFVLSASAYGESKIIHFKYHNKKNNFFLINIKVHVIYFLFLKAETNKCIFTSLKKAGLNAKLHPIAMRKDT